MQGPPEKKGDAGSAAKRFGENENAVSDAVCCNGADDKAALLLCFLGIKDAESGSRHFLFASKISLPDF